MKSLSSSSFRQHPATRIGWWGAGLTAAFVVMFAINSLVFMPAYHETSATGWVQVLLPFYGIFMMLCGLAGGILGLIAILRNHERSWLVWLTILPGAFVLFLLLGEFLVSH